MRFDLSAAPSAVRSLLRRLFRPRSARGRPAAAAKGYVSRIISDAVQFNEIPSPTENEAERAAFIARKLAEFGVSDVTLGAEGSVGCTIPAFDPNGGCVLLVSNTSNEAFSPLQSLVRLTDREAAGNGIADNSLGVATMLVLAEYLSREQVPLTADVVLFFSPMSRGAELEAFVRERVRSAGAALYVSGLQLGDVEVRQLGTCELAVSVRTAESAASAVSVLAAMATRLGSVRWSADNETILRVARLEAGTGLGYFPSEGTMEVEITSPATALLQMAKDAAAATIRSTADEMGAALELRETLIAPPGKEEERLLVVKALQDVHRELGIRSRAVSSALRLPYLGLLDIPVVTVGVTTGRKSRSEEVVDLAPVETGFRQLLLLLQRLAVAPGEAAA